MFQQLVYSPPMKRDMVMQHYTTKEGLGESVPRQVLRDEFGFLWVCHGQGVSRFDGYTFRNYTEGPNSGIRGKDIGDLYIDSDDRLWALSAFGQLNLYEREKDDFVFKVKIPDSLFKNNRYNLVQFRPDTLLIMYLPERNASQLRFTFYQPSTGSVGVYELPLKEKYDERLPDWYLNGYSSLQFYKIAPDGTEWLSLGHLLLTRKKGEPRFSIVEIPEMDAFVRLFHRTIHFEGDSIVYLGTNWGLVEFNRKDNTYIQYFYNSETNNFQDHIINSIYQILEEPQYLWMGTFLSSVLRFNINTKEFEQVFDPLNRLNSTISGIHIDKQGILWIASNVNGLFKVNPIALRTSRFLVNQKENERDIQLGVTEIWPLDDSTMFVSSFENGYYYVSLNGEILLSENRVEPDRYLPQKSIWSGWIDQEQTLWLSSSSGLTAKPDFQNPGNPFKYYDLPVQTKLFSRSVMGNKKDRIWYSSINGLHEYNYVTDRWRWYKTKDEGGKFPPEVSISMMFDSKNRLWLAHDSEGVSVVEFIGDSIRVKQFMPEGATSEDVLMVYRILELESGGYLLSSSNGLYKINDGLDIMRKYPLHPKLDTEKINVTYIDSIDRMWFGTINGIFVLEPDGRLIHLVEEDGMHNREINHAAVRDKNGGLWFSSYNGVVKFHSDTMGFDSTRYAPKLVNFEVIGAEQPESISEKIELSYLQNNIKLAVSNFDLRDPQSQQWWFRLSGFSEEWYPATDQNIVQFTNLDPGKYEIDARVESRYGYTQTKASVLSLEIIPAYWQTAWFRFLIATLVVGIFVLLIHLRIERYRKVREERDRIMGDLHDDLSSVLATVNFNVQTLQPNQKLEPRMYARLRNVSETAVQTMQDLIWSVDPKNDTWGKITDSFKSYVNNVIGGKNWKVSWSISGKTETIIQPVLRKQLFLIFKEIIANTLKHSEASEIEIQFTLTSEIYLVVKDNGRGFNSDKITRGVGLTSVEKRLKELNADWKVHSNGGTAWEIRIPIN